MTALNAIQKRGMKKTTPVLSVTNSEDENMKLNGKSITELLAVNRRNFIKLAAGGAVGTGLSPLPWKLIDDTAIFTQNFPWVPVPDEGRFTKVKSHCTLCAGGCGIEVRKSGKRAVKIEGRSDHPVNPGGICPLGMGGLQLLYNENSRFTGPMKRIGPRGSGEFKQITWEEALSTLSLWILELRNKGKASSIVTVDGNRQGSTMAAMVERFTKAIGSPNYMRMPTSESTSKDVSDNMFGNKGHVTFDLENSDYILSFGCGLLEGWGSPGRVLNTWGLWRSDELKDRVKIIQIESRASNTASKADKWIPAKPGTEMALALGIASVIIKEGLYDKNTAENDMKGFLPFKTKEGEAFNGFKNLVLENYTPEKVSLITGISAEDITDTAKAFASASAPVAICGKGKGLLNGDPLEYAAVYALNALTGRINKPGGLILCENIPLTPFPEIEIDDIAEEALKTPRIDRAEDSSIPGQSLFNNLADTILASPAPAVDIMMFFASNPAFTLPDGGDFHQCLAQTTYVISFSPYRDETALMADLILPDHTYLEKTDEAVSPSTIQYPFYGLTQPVIKALYDTRNCGDVILTLAGMLGGAVKKSFPWETYSEVLSFRIRGLYDSSKGTTEYNPEIPAWSTLKNENTGPGYENFEGLFDQLMAGGMWYIPASDKSPDAELIKPDLYNKHLLGRLEKSEGDISEEAEHKKEMYPLVMVPYEMINLSSGWISSPPYLNKTLLDDQLLKKDSFIEINPETAEKYHICENDKITVSSGKGKAEVRVHLFEGAMPGVVYMPAGFGHTAFDDFTKGKGCNPNRIMTGTRDITGGQPAWWCTPVKINKVHI